MSKPITKDQADIIVGFIKKIDSRTTYIIFAVNCCLGAIVGHSLAGTGVLDWIFK